MQCPFCSEEIKENAVKCKHCGSIVDKERYSQMNHVLGGTTRASAASFDDLPEYYKNAFIKIDENSGQFVAIFNWAALFFGAFWYFYKGMWAKGAIMICLTLLLAGVPAIIFWIYCGVAGTFDLYLLKIKNKQLW